MTSKSSFLWVNSEREEVKWSFEELGFLSRKVANILWGMWFAGETVRAVLLHVPKWWLLNVACMWTGEWRYWSLGCRKKIHRRYKKYAKLIWKKISRNMLLCSVQFSFCIEGELAVPTLETKWHCTRCWTDMVQFKHHPQLKPVKVEWLLSKARLDQIHYQCGRF